MQKEKIENALSKLFKLILKRNINATEMQTRLSKISADKDTDTFILETVDELISSEEFKHNHGENRNFQRVTKADVFYAFKFLLGRLPEHQAIYDDKLRRNSTPELINEIVASDEFKSNTILKHIISIKRKPKGFDEILAKSAASKKNALVLSGCQGRMIADLLQAGGGFGFVENIYLSIPQLKEFISNKGQDHRKLMAWADLIYTQKQDIYNLFKDSGEFGKKIRFIPLAEYAGFQPDLCNLTDNRNGSAIVGPMGEYQSLILTASYFAELDAASAVRLFNQDTYAKLGFPAISSNSKIKFLDQEGTTGYPLTSMLEKWDKSGKWMRTNNHPKKFVLADFVRLALEKEGITPLRDFEDFVADDLAGNADWPEYGASSSDPKNGTSDLHFKRPKALSPLSNSAEFIGLQDFVEMFYRSMEGYSIDSTSCHQLGKKIDLKNIVEVIRSIAQ